MALPNCARFPTKDALKALIEKAQQVPANRLSAKDAARLESALDRALNTLADPFADEEAIAAEEENLRTVLKSLSTSSTIRAVLPQSRIRLLPFMEQRNRHCWCICSKGICSLRYDSAILSEARFCLLLQNDSDQWEWIGS